MQSGRVYVGRLPNHSGPVFVRKRRKSFANPFGVPSVTSIYGAQHYAPDYQCTTTAVYQPPPPPLPYMIPAPPAQVVQVPPPADATTTTVTTTVEPQPPPASSKHSCASCGKFRSASVSSNALQARNSMTWNEHIGNDGNVRAAERSSTDPIPPTNGLVPPAKKSGGDTIGTDHRREVGGIKDPISQAQAPVRRFTSCGGLKSDPKRDVDNEPAPQRMSASFAIHEEYREDVQVDDDDYFEPPMKMSMSVFPPQPHEAGL
ncbi:MAG: hypothetical protein Q9178_003403 [Gyalolechia marmorata]